MRHPNKLNPVNFSARTVLDLIRGGPRNITDPVNGFRFLREAYKANRSFRPVVEMPYV